MKDEERDHEYARERMEEKRGLGVKGAQLD